MKTLYDYQKWSLKLVLSAIQKIERALMVMAPGLGKTVVSAFFLKKTHRLGKKILFLCDDNFILAQAHAEYRETFDPKGLLIFHNFFGTKKDIDAAKVADVVFASFQSLNHVRSKWYQLFDRKHFHIIVVDEGHHVKAVQYAEVIEYFEPEVSLCMTGTPDRMDNQDIRDYYGDEVVNITIEEGIARGWLSPVEYHVLSDGLDKEKLKKLFQDVVVEKRKISVNQINKLLFIKKRDDEQIRLIRDYSDDWNKKTIIFCESLDHVRTFAKQLRKQKAKYVTFHSDNTNRKNTKNLEAFKFSRMNVILTVDKFNEGIDVPDAEVIVFLRGTDSSIIYRQQLGRGLRKKKGKEKVIVLDFVSNIERMLMIQGMVEVIRKFRKKKSPDRSLLGATGENFSFDFSDELKDISEILKVARMGFYPTWQEASKAAIGLGVQNALDYRERYKEDRQLPSAPEATYPGFPGYDVFLGGIEYYVTWQEAATAAKKLGITNTTQYQLRYKEDPRLPPVPNRKYPDLPGMIEFFGRKRTVFYPTLKEASTAAIKLGITSPRDYNKKRSKDKKLPSNPNVTYTSEWKSWPQFLGQAESVEHYSTWKQAAKAAKKLKITSSLEYQTGAYKKDPRLPSDLYRAYADFPGFPVFFGREVKEYYPTCQKASKAAIGLGIKSSTEYAQRYSEDPKLYNSPHKHYADWPGWEKFLKSKPKEPRKCYLTWQQASKASIVLGISSHEEYRALYKKDPLLPSNLARHYPDFPGYPTFLKNEK